MKIEHLQERIDDYCQSVEKVIDKKTLWQSTTKPLLLSVLNRITEKYRIGWKVQQLNWLTSNESINITFDAYPETLIQQNKVPASHEFITGCALIFSQAYNGEIHIFILFPIVDNLDVEESTLQLGIYNPQEITEKLIIEKVDEFLKEMINWEVPMEKKRLGFKTN